MAKLKDNYTMEAGMTYIKGSKSRNIIFGVVGCFFPFFPPYFLGFDPQYHSVEAFYLYLLIFYVCLLVFLGKCTDKPRKVQKIINEKAILLGCPVNIKEMGAAGSNSYSITVMVNDSMFDTLKDVRVEDIVEQQEESVAMAEPYTHQYAIGSGSSGKFVHINVPHYDIARKLGQIPEIPEQQETVSTEIQQDEESKEKTETPLTGEELPEPEYFPIDTSLIDDDEETEDPTQDETIIVVDEEEE